MGLRRSAMSEESKPVLFEAPRPDSRPETIWTRMHRSITRRLLGSTGARWAFVGGLVVLLGGAAALVAAGTVKVKMLPFDNKAEFQVQLEMPAGTDRKSVV